MHKEGIINLRTDNCFYKVREHIGVYPFTSRAGGGVV
jgi:hypothetical protein